MSESERPSFVALGKRAKRDYQVIYSDRPSAPQASRTQRHISSSQRARETSRDRSTPSSSHAHQDHTSSLRRPSLNLEVGSPGDRSPITYHSACNRVLQADSVDYRDPRAGQPSGSAGPAGNQDSSPRESWTQHINADGLSILA